MTYCDETIGALDWLCGISAECGGFYSTERPGQRASRSEMSRWFKKGSVYLDLSRLRATDLLPWPTAGFALTLHPKSKSKVTL